MANQSIPHRMEAMENKIDALVQAIRDMQSDMTTMKADICETKEIVQAWKSVKLWAQFLKWAAGIVTAGGVIIAVIKGVWHK